MTETTETGAPDWTTDPETGHRNSSELFGELCGDVERMIRGGAHHLIAGDAGAVARVIVAQLAHVHHLAPATRPTEDPSTPSAPEGPV